PAKTAKILNIPFVLTSSQEQNVQGPLLPELEQILPEAFAARVKRAGIVNAWNDHGAEKPHYGWSDDGRVPGLPGNQCRTRRIQRTGGDGRQRVAVRNF